jgi:hypothetical protein
MSGSGKGIERLECVYYAGPIPRDLATLVVLSLVFDNSLPKRLPADGGLR